MRTPVDQPASLEYPYTGKTAQVSHERWLVSYADFMTLLMAFFVVMYSISQVSEQKYRVLSETFTQAFNAPVERENLLQDGEPQKSHTATPVDLDGHALEDRPGNDANEVPETFTRISEQLEQSFQQLIEKELIQVTGDERWLQIELPSEVLFGSGGVAMSETAQAIIDEIAATLVEHNNVIRVEGFTDNVPIKTRQFASNWELSTARAAAVVKQLSKSGIAPERLAAVGYGEFQPAVSNRTAAGRSKNRRIVLMVSTRDRLRPDAEQVDELPVGDYAARPPLPDGTLVRGLERSALDEARAWLANRYAASAKPEQGADTQVLPNAAGLSRSSAAPAAGVQQLTLDNGALLFTNSVDN
ncbi:MAG: flagellar motor protein MotD [Pseudomonadales bacterium]|nr:flagellar motor protein MotD [Pseudomonadales bacterium]